MPGAIGTTTALGGNMHGGDAGGAPSFSSSPSKRRNSLSSMGRPLQICEIDFDENCVKTCHENLQVIEENLKSLAASLKVSEQDLKVSVISVMGITEITDTFRSCVPMSQLSPEQSTPPASLKMSEQELKVSVISVMGMYRTGKSFLLDLLLRYLRISSSNGGEPTAAAMQPGKEQPSAAAITNFEPSKVWRMGEKTYPADAYSWLGGERISEGQTNERGFHWRPGIEKCTKGIWLWSLPFLMENAETGEPLAVLVMDTQGAWDSQMSSEQSSCIFGITALLSSKLIYNLQNRISEEKIDNLDYFTTYAGIVIQEAKEKAAATAAKKGAVIVDTANHPDDSSDSDDDAGLGDIHFLVRDWEYFEDSWSLDQCTKQVSEHLMTHLDPGRVAVEERKETITRLHNLFRSVNLCCLPHPGPKIPKANWTGQVADIDTDFLYLLTHFFANLSHGEYPLKVASPLGQELNCKSFCRVIETLTSAFKNARTDATSLRKAFVTCETHRAREDALQAFTDFLQSQANAPLMKDGVPSTDANMLDPETMTQFLQELKAQQMSLFKSRIKTLFPSGCTKEEEAWKSELLLEVEQALDEKAKWIAERNSNAYTQATWKLVATPVVTLPVCMSVLSLPHLLLYGAVGIAGAWHLNFRAGDEGVKGWFAPEVLERVGEDIKKFCWQRYVDVKQMAFVARRCDKLPQQFSESVQGTPVQAGMAAVTGAATAAMNTVKTNNPAS